MEATAVRHELRVMDPKAGDVKIEWDPDRADEVDLARKQFEEAQRKGMLIYKLDRRGRQGDVMRTFDPLAERIIATPRHVGG